MVGLLPVRKPRDGATDKSTSIDSARIIHVHRIDGQEGGEKHPYRHERAVEDRKHIDRQAPPSQVPWAEGDLLF